MAISPRWGALGALARAVRAATRPGSPSLGERFAAVPRLVRATAAGQYHGTTRGRLLMILAAALYVISPVDLVPEVLLSVVGLADDALVVGWIATALVNETESFLAWERGERRSPSAAETVQGHVIR